MIKNDIFSTPIWNGHIDLNDTILNKFLKLATEQNYVDQKSSIDGAIQTLNLIEEPNFYHSKNAIENLFFEETHNKVKMINAWICKNPPGSRNRQHVHGGCDISGVYYIKVPENSGIIRFANPNPVAIHKDLHKKEKCFWQEYSMYPKEKGILFFPCWVPHEVETNKSQEDRLALSFNMVYI